jgi:dipeptidyl aminopeptidase/acylaminoacyl peptidase
MISTSTRRIAVNTTLLLLSFHSTLSAQPAATAPATTQSTRPAGILPNANLVADGIPPLPEALVDDVNRYTEFRAAMMLDWHPTERQMLIATRFANTAQVHRLKFPGGARTQMTFFPEPVDDASCPPNNAGFFVFGKDVGGNEFNQNFRFDYATGAVTLLTDGKSKTAAACGTARAICWPTPRPGETARTPTSTPSIPPTPPTPGSTSSSRKWKAAAGGRWTFPRTASSSCWRSTSRSTRATSGSSTRRSTPRPGARSGRSRLARPTAPSPVSYGHAEFSADGTSIFTTTDKDSEYQRLAKVNLATGEHTFLTQGVNWDVEDFDLSPDRKIIAYVVNEDGASVLHLLDATTGKELPKPLTPVGVIYNLRWHANSRDLGFTMSSARSTADVYSLDTLYGKVERWTESETGGLNPETFSEPKLARWKSFDGREISGFLYAPDEKKYPGKRPVVIEIHGGPEGQSRPGFIGRRNYLVNELGLALIYPNVRGSTGYGKNFLKLDNADKRLDSVKDIGALLDWIKTQPGLDADRIMVTGGSYGGYMTLAVATEYNDRSPLLARRRRHLQLRHVPRAHRGLPPRPATRGVRRRARPEMRAWMEKIAPLNNAQRITKPLFIVQGKNDPRVPLNEAEQMVATVKKNGTPVWYLMAKDEGHGFAKKPNADYQFFATVQFMKQFLLN